MADISREGLTRIHAKFWNAYKLRKTFTEVVTLLKIITWKNPTGPVMSGSVREYKPP